MMVQAGSIPAAQHRPLIIVAAVARNGVIGAGNALPWRLGSDLARFRALTMGRPLIMGRKTFESLPPARAGGKGRLPGRSLVVLTRSGFAASPDDGEVLQAKDLSGAIGLADELARRDGAGEIVIAGGDDVFSQALPLVSGLHLTLVDASPDGDAFFPAIDNSVFHEVSREAHQPGPRDDHAFVFVDYERRQPAATQLKPQAGQESYGGT